MIDFRQMPGAKPAAPPPQPVAPSPKSVLPEFGGLVLPIPEGKAVAAVNNDINSGWAEIPQDPNVILQAGTEPEKVPLRPPGQNIPAQDNTVKIETLSPEEQQATIRKFQEMFKRFDPATIHAAVVQPAPAAAPPPPVAPIPEPQPVQPPPAPPESEKPHSPFCGHCGWPADTPETPMPDEVDQLLYLQSSLGGIPFSKTLEAFKGQLQLTFRELTTSEWDAIHQQIFYDRQSGAIITEMDHHEMIARYRLCLQMQKLVSQKLNHVLPEGLSPETNPFATSHWTTSPGFAERLAGSRPLPLILSYIKTYILPTESLYRTAYATVRDFNRLVNKLEDLRDNPDFIFAARPLGG